MVLATLGLLMSVACLWAGDALSARRTALYASAGQRAGDAEGPVKGQCGADRSDLRLATCDLPGPPEVRGGGAFLPLEKAWGLA